MMTHDPQGGLFEGIIRRSEQRRYLLRLQPAAIHLIQGDKSGAASGGIGGIESSRNRFPFTAFNDGIDDRVFHGAVVDGRGGGHGLGTESRASEQCDRGTAQGWVGGKKKLGRAPACGRLVVKKSRTRQFSLP